MGLAELGDALSEHGLLDSPATGAPGGVIAKEDGCSHGGEPSLQLMSMYAWPAVGPLGLIGPVPAERVTTTALTGLDWKKDVVVSLAKVGSGRRAASRSCSPG